MNKVTNWEKLKLLFWKNWILQWSRKLQFFVALLLPIVFASLMVLIRSLVKPEQMPETHYPPVSINDLKLYQKSILKGNRIMHDNGTLNIPKMMVIYAPKNEIYDKIILRTVFKLRLFGYKGFPNRQELENELMAHNYFSGVQFPDSNADITTYPRNFTYSLRFPSELRTAQGPMILNWQTNRLFPFYDFSGPRNHNNSDGGVPVGYIMEGFLPLQHAISTSYLELASRREYSIPGIQIQRYPYPKYIYDPLLSGLLEVLPLMLLLCFIYPCTFIAKFVTNEKEKQLKEVMKIMGLHNWLHWTAWFVKSFMILAIVACVLTFLLKFHFFADIAIFTYTDWSVLIFFFFIYICASICFCFMLAVFFSKASTASSVTGIMWFLSYVPYSMAFYYYDRISLTTKLLTSLLSNTALGFGFRVLMAFEGTGEGMQWRNIATPVSSDDSLTLLYIILMLILATFIYMFICLYVEQIYPGNYGVPKRWNFPFQAQFWTDCINKFKRRKRVQMKEVEEQQINTDEYSENRIVGLSIRNLEKSYGKRLAVKDLSLDMYVNEITVLLGHNGAGKTTTIFMLTGIIPPTKGTAIINGYDIRTELSGARQSLGICPQHNVLFEDMSVKNHIIFFSLLKGIRGKAAINQEVKKYMRIMELDSKQYIAVSKLSGGMKRKLSLCCALCGNTRTVLCDEPSSGVDTAARRRLWDLLQAEKQGRTILLTTHYMDEADVLGDRIAIMCDGRLQCYDTPFELKKRYGSGYRLTCVKREGCIAAEVTDLLQQFIPNIKPESEIGTELTYRLPTDYRHRFPEIFRMLENRSEELNLSGYGVSIATLEEVFMRVGAEHIQETQQLDSEGRSAGGGGRNVDELIFDDNTKSEKRCVRIMQKWHAMLYKKALVTYRSKVLFLIQFLLPVIFMVLTIYNASGSTVYFTLTPLPIDLSTYSNAVIVLEVTKDVHPNSIEAKIAHEYELYIKSFKKSKYKFTTTNGESFEDYILSIAKKHISRVDHIYVAAATVKAGICVAWLNNKPLHTAPLTLNILHNAVARVLIGQDAEIHVINDPLPYSNDTLIRRLNKGTRLGAEIAVNLCLCMCFVTAFYIIPLIKEHHIRSKLLQFVSGVNIFIYWASHFLWDFLIFTLLALLAIVTIGIFQEPGFATVAELSRYMLLLFVFGMAVLPVTYVLSFCFSDTATGFSRTAIFNLFIGTGLFSVYIALSAEIFHIQHIANMLAWYFRIFPHFSLALGMHRLHVGSNIRRGCQIDYIQNLSEKLRCQVLPICCNIPGYFAWKRPGVLPELVYLLCTAVLVMLFLIAIESKFLTWIKVVLKRKLKKDRSRQLGGTIDTTVDRDDDDDDDDVIAERERVLRLTSVERDALPLVVDRISKHYRKHVAVHQATFCVSLNECFGLLGINGAGKTSIFKMLTGDISITHGRAFVKGICVNTNVHNVYKNIGYCPQFDGILEELTGRETIRIYCLLRNIRTTYIRRLTHELALSFGFLKHIDKQVQHYSGGNKRKLCTALALIGNPIIMYLDEPTSGMDPAARRQLWNMMCRIRDRGKSIVLTSHSMEECETLCTRLVIMVNGVFKCMGSTQHIKNKFSKGLILKIKVLKVTKPETEENGNKKEVKEVQEISMASENEAHEENGNKKEVKEVQAISMASENEAHSSFHSEEDNHQLEKPTSTKKEDETILQPEVVPIEHGKTTTQVTPSISNEKEDIQEESIILEPSKITSPSEMTEFQSKEFEMHFELGSSHHILKIKQFMTSNLPSSELQEEYEGLLTYYIPMESIKWSELFALIEDNRTVLNIEDYTISQTTLEEIFLEFAKERR